ncbi:MAG: DUF4445 domain-containing protein [Tissierellia bacterium]|nr:DUF4445 domain-containing protein [Tissierellia bacterium]
MPKINFVKENICIEVEKNTILLDAIRQANLNIETPCNGMGFCGKCKVIAKGQLSEPTDREKKIINEEKYERLSCMAEVLGDVEVELIEKKKALKTINKGFSIDVEIDSPVKLVRLPEIDGTSPIPYADYIGYRVSSPELYRKIAFIEEGNFKEIWGVVFEDRLLDIATYKKDVLGLAVDIGTTGISYYLVDLSNGQVVENLSSLNPQSQYGGDVLTRITYCMENPSGAVKLQGLIVDEINNMIKKIVDNLYNIDDIYHIAIAANTTMMHLLLGINPESLAKAPYRSIFLSCEDIKARDISIKANKEALLTIIPSASSYVGGDIVSGIMASGFQDNKEAVFIDIGTNGELAALKDGKIICTSTAAGPALEGMNIECGCRAEEGAIEKFDIDENYNINYSTIGNAKAIGICGSGLIDIAGTLVKRDIVMKSGRWNKNINPKLAERIVDKKFYITNDIYISQKDIRQIQLAKGAIAAGIIMMLDEIGLTIEEIPLVYIAGAFGYHINPSNIMEIGLIPKGFNGDIKFLGNTSLEGARFTLINNDCYKKVYEIKENMEVLELSLKENFQNVFVSQLNF